MVAEENVILKEQDIILLHHEALEHYLMNKYNYSYDITHDKVNSKYNYETFIKRSLKMLSLHKVFENKDFIKYEYIPECLIENGTGEIVVKKTNSKVESFKLSNLELKFNSLNYCNKAFIAIKDFIKEDDFPTNYKIAWY
ncbi:hypothetical protein [Staphylococcus borealis]|uniref:hypothetical protein n=1 Tax=Staphylococcus borealis TaxID=2742203 RepID=UPI0039E8536A